MSTQVSQSDKRAFDILDEGSLPRPIGLGIFPVGVRLFLVLCALVAAALTTSTLSLLVQVLILVFAAIALGRFRPLIASWRLVFWVSFSLLIIYAWAFPGSTTFVLIFGVEGFLQGLFIAVRLLLFVSVFYLFLLTTGPLAIVRWAGTLNESFGVMLSLTLGIVPVMQQQMHTTLQAQQARGMAVDGNLFIKLKSYLAVMIPVVVKSLVRAYQMAILLHVRGLESGQRVRVTHQASIPIVSGYVVGVVWVALALVARLAVQ